MRWSGWLTLSGLLALSGCGTIVAHSADDRPAGAYAGTACATYILTIASMAPWPGWPFVPWLVLDVPVSALADTVMLPVDLPNGTRFDCPAAMH